MPVNSVKINFPGLHVLSSNYDYVPQINTGYTIVVSCNDVEIPSDGDSATGSIDVQVLAEDGREIKTTRISLEGGGDH